MKILIVDDKKENLYLLERIIKKMGYEVVMAENGKQALEKLNSDNIKIVISDILMPVMDGFQLCKAVKSNKKFKDLLFVFYTATYIEKEDEEFALDLGADKFIRKPLKPEKFIETIKNLIQKTEISLVKPRKPIIKEEKEILKLYSERLIHKLENKILDLEKEITERRKIEEWLRVKDNAIKSSINAIAIADLEKNLTYVNPSWLKIWGYSSENEVLGKSILNFWHINKENADKVIKDLQETDSWVGELIGKRKDGSFFDIQLSASTVIDSKGNPISLMASFIDITERKITEQKLRESEEKYRLISENANDLITTLNEKFQIEYRNEEVHRKIMGYTKEEVIGKNSLNFVHPNDVEKAISIFKEALKVGEGMGEFRSKTKKGDYIWLESKGKIFIDKDGKRKCLTISRDITERKKAEEEIKKFRRLVEQSIDGIAIGDLEPRLQYVNDSFARMHGYSPKEMIGMTVENLFNEEQMDKFTKGINQIKTEGSWVSEIDHIKRDGTSFPTYMTVTLLKYDDGKTIGVFVICRDITEQKRAIEKLKKSENKYHELFENMSSGCSIFKVTEDGLDYIYKDFNRSGEKIDNLKRDDLIGRSVFDLFPDAMMKSGINKVFERVWKTGKSEHFIGEFEIKGKMVYRDNLFYKLPSGDLVVIFDDITERKNAELKLKESEKKYRHLIETSSMGIIEVEMEKRKVSYVNPKFMEIIGYTIDDLKDEKIMHKIIHSDDIKNLFKTSNEKKLEFRIHDQQGNLKWLFGSRVNKYNDKGELENIRIWVDDITEKKDLELKFTEKLEQEVKLSTQELNSALELKELLLDQILKASQFKSEFLASMSHELRTPLNSIIGFTDILLEGYYGKINEKQDQYLNDVRSSGTHLLDLINKILNISKIEAGEIELNIEKIQLKNVINQVKNTIKPLYKEKKLKFEIIGLDEEKVIQADSTRFKEILYNLLSNAVKYTKAGGFKLEILEHEHHWEFNIIDTGIGIAKEDFDLIFKEFKRAKSDYVASVEGTGLGLSLTKRLINLHGGNISFTSELGKGTTFTFTLPKR